jgi:prepilin-type N-terminal cleavage/methylation domain-containing protein
MRSRFLNLSGEVRDDGFTIAELMISLIIMVIVASQLTLILLTQNRVYAEQHRVLDAQEDARLVAEIIATDLRVAGFLIPNFVGISSQDGGTSGADALCTSDPTVISETSVDEAIGTIDRVALAANLGAGSTQVTVASLDVDLDGDNDFSKDAGIIISDGTGSHCARITGVDASTKVIAFTPKTPASGFTAASITGRAVPALIYEVSGSGLSRNGELLSPRVENLQIEYAIDGDGNGRIEGAEFPIHDLAGDNPSDIRGVQLSVITRSSRSDPQFKGSGMPAAANHTGTGADGFRRRRVTLNVAPRNLR